MSNAHRTHSSMVKISTRSSTHPHPGRHTDRPAEIVDSAASAPGNAPRTAGAATHRKPPSRSRTADPAFATRNGDKRGTSLVLSTERSPPPPYHPSSVSGGNSEILANPGGLYQDEMNAANRLRADLPAKWLQEAGLSSRRAESCDRYASRGQSQSATGLFIHRKVYPLQGDVPARGRSPVRSKDRELPPLPLKLKTQLSGRSNSAPPSPVSLPPTNSVVKTAPQDRTLPPLPEKLDFRPSVQSNSAPPSPICLSPANAVVGTASPDEYTESRSESTTKDRRSKALPPTPYALSPTTPKTESNPILHCNPDVTVIEYCNSPVTPATISSNYGSSDRRTSCPGAIMRDVSTTPELDSDSNSSEASSTGIRTPPPGPATSLYSRPAKPKVSVIKKPIGNATAVKFMLWDEYLDRLANHAGALLHSNRLRTWEDLAMLGEVDAFLLFLGIAPDLKDGVWRLFDKYRSAVATKSDMQDKFGALLILWVNNYDYRMALEREEIEITFRVPIEAANIVISKILQSLYKSTAIMNVELHIHNMECSYTKRFKVLGNDLKRYQDAKVNSAWGRVHAASLKISADKKLPPFKCDQIRKATENLEGKCKEIGKSSARVHSNLKNLSDNLVDFELDLLRQLSVASLVSNPDLLLEVGLWRAQRYAQWVAKMRIDSNAGVRAVCQEAFLACNYAVWYALQCAQQGDSDEQNEVKRYLDKIVKSRDQPHLLILYEMYDALAVSRRYMRADMSKKFTDVEDFVPVHYLSVLRIIVRVVENAAKNVAKQRSRVRDLKVSH